MNEIEKIYSNMKKYYFLDKHKLWKGPYRYPQILYFCLNGAIQPTSYIWHNKLAVDIGEHPLVSIYARKYAYEYRSFPVWVFRSNIKILSINVLKKWKKRFSKKDSFENFIAKPIGIPPILKEAKESYLIPSIVAIHDFIAPGDFKIKLIYIERDGKEEIKTVEYPIKLTFDSNPGIKFEITMAVPPSVGGVEHKESYGLHRRLFLKGENMNIRIEENSVFDFSTKFPYKPQILKGRFKQANFIIDSNYENEYNRLIIRIDDDKPIVPQDILLTTGNHIYDYDDFNIHPSLMGISFRHGGTYTDVVVDGASYKFYCIKEKLIVIEGKCREKLEIFRQKAEIMRIALAILSGKFCGGSCSYVSATDPDFKYTNGVWLEIEKPTVISNRQTINFKTFRSTFDVNDDNDAEKYKAINSFISPELFSALCEKLYTDENLLRVAELVISGMGNNDPLQQGALYSVALETLTTVLGEKKSKQLKPIVDDKVSATFVADLKEVLHKYEDKVSKEGFVILGKNIDGINRPTNQDKLVKTFELFGITLSEKDKSVIGKRNDYLHGRNPLKTKLIFELTQISLRLHTLIVALLLKSVGYSGHIVNLDIYAYCTDENKAIEIASDVYEKITALSQELQKAFEEQNKSRLNELKEQLEKIKTHELRDLIRII